ncbi:MAG: ribosome maturation factor RimM [Gammaproteobacteria bacterium]|nr:ribosome maturation factor RimM [Gammaproteobacteria bacterium]
MGDLTEELLELGKISGVFGVKGWVKVHSFTDPREGIVDYGSWLIKQQGSWREVQLETGQRQGKTVIAKIRGVEDRDQAMLLMGAKIAIRPDQLAGLEQDEYYWRDLEGLRVVNTDGVDFGIVDHMLETGANDVMVVEGDRERLIPFTLGEAGTGHAVLKVDLAAGEITVDWDADF